jgi:hypothetical protein
LWYQFTTTQKLIQELCRVFGMSKLHTVLFELPVFATASLDFDYFHCPGKFRGFTSSTIVRRQHIAWYLNTVHFSQRLTALDKTFRMMRTGTNTITFHTAAVDYRVTARTGLETTHYCICFQHRLIADGAEINPRWWKTRQQSSQIAWRNHVGTWWIEQRAGGSHHASLVLQWKEPDQIKVVKIIQGRLKFRNVHVQVVDAVSHRHEQAMDGLVKGAFSRIILRRGVVTVAVAFLLAVGAIIIDIVFPKGNPPIDPHKGAIGKLAFPLTKISTNEFHDFGAR